MERYMADQDRNFSMEKFVVLGCALFGLLAILGVARSLDQNAAAKRTLEQSEIAPDVTKVQELLRNAKAGDVVLVEVAFTGVPFRYWRVGANRGGTLLLDSGCEGITRLMHVKEFSEQKAHVIRNDITSAPFIAAASAFLKCQ
jgi:hypothetical protein